MTELNLNAHLQGMIERFSGYLLSDLMALEEQTAAKASGKETRSAIKTVAHCAAFYRMIAAILETGQRPEISDEQRQAFLDSVTTREQASIAFTAAKDALMYAIDGYPVDRWDEDLPGFLGPKTLNAATFAIIHTMYHDGQLNHVHLLEGDADMHWPGLG